ncbi:hypothetical protein WN943_028301 [Citrus x changshan-huyou]
MEWRNMNQGSLKLEATKNATGFLAKDVCSEVTVLGIA